MTAPRTKARKSATVPYTAPRSQPMPSTSFTSPKPIHRPFDVNQRIKSGNAVKGPARARTKISDMFKLPAVPVNE